jgi:hydroxymethylpyrimidine pyrophosphatase-like HAD family hydrolase
VLRCLYVDLDGTLLGRRASLLHDGEGVFTLIGVRALEACARAGAEVVLYSGRRRAQVFEDARIIGSRAYVFEAGCGLVMDGELTWLTGDLTPNERTIFEQIEDLGAPALLLDRYAGRLEYHTPWHRDREVSHLFRGLVDPFEAESALRDAGIEGLRLVDNGAIAYHRTLPDIEHPHAYHLIPGAASKARAVATHMRARSYARDEVIAAGDSREDMGAAEAVGTFWLVRNALDRDPTLADDIASHGNVRVTDASYGAGVYEAVVTTLAEGRGG